MGEGGGGGGAKGKREIFPLSLPPSYFHSFLHISIPFRGSIWGFHDACNICAVGRLKAEWNHVIKHMLNQWKLSSSTVRE